ncbi:RNA polymerase II transcription factor SIII subunit A-domain-containing protein [Cytidiella melzeri]|nr:RNA polymerase II transcription factor SIII subunit A-domain-containing protein [Cytidiella melzeri]
MASRSARATTSRIPSLVNICQRVASAHLESMSSLGENMPIDLVRPILQNCSAEVLVRFEDANPELCTETSDMWKALCFRTFSLAAERHFTADSPECWREAYFRLQELEKERLDAVAARLRLKREEERKRKEDTQIKLTDRMPPVKRTRGSTWGTPTQPKTLFQKTRLGAAKIQKGIYASHMNPSTSMVKASSWLPNTSSSSLARVTTTASAASSTPTSSPASTIGTRVTVTSVRKHQEVPIKSLANSPPSSRQSPLRTAGNLTLSSPEKTNLSLTRTPGHGFFRATSSSQTRPSESRVLPLKVRKNSASTLLMPKPPGQYLPTYSGGMRPRA